MRSRARRELARGAIEPAALLALESLSQARLATVHTAQTARAIFDIIHNTSGTTGGFMRSPLERKLRDAHMAAAHGLITCLNLGMSHMSLEPPKNASRGARDLDVARELTPRPSPRAMISGPLRRIRGDRGSRCGPAVPRRGCPRPDDPSEPQRAVRHRHRTISIPPGSRTLTPAGSRPPLRHDATITRLAPPFGISERRVRATGSAATAE